MRRVYARRRQFWLEVCPPGAATRHRARGATGAAAAGRRRCHAGAVGRRAADPARHAGRDPAPDRRPLPRGRLLDGRNVRRLHRRPHQPIRRQPGCRRTGRRRHPAALELRRTRRAGPRCGCSAARGRGGARRPGGGRRRPAPVTGGEGHRDGARRRAAGGRARTARRGKCRQPQSKSLPLHNAVEQLRVESRQAAPSAWRCRRGRHWRRRCGHGARLPHRHRA